MEKEIDLFGICMYTLIPVRRTASESSEMVTQLLFGEMYRMLEQEGKWQKIISCFDDYEGWIDVKLIQNISENDKEILLSAKFNCLAEEFLFMNTDNGSKQPIVAGSSLYGINNDGFFVILGRSFNLGIPVNTYEAKRKNIAPLAKRFLNAPYLWGGRTILGIDCSGLTQVVYKIIGINLPRDASQQIERGKNVSFINEAEEGDLAFFDNEDGRIIHVGIMLDSHTIIHASGNVRIDAIDHQGIYNKELNKYTHRLRMIKRVL